MRHPDEEALLDLALGGADPDTTAHVRECPACAVAVAERVRDLERLRALDGVELDEPAPPLSRAQRRTAGRLLRVAALLALAAVGGVGGVRWLYTTRLEVVAYAPPPPRSRGLEAVACPVGDLAVRMDTLRAGD